MDPRTTRCARARSRTGLLRTVSGPRSAIRLGCGTPARGGAPGSGIRPDDTRSDGTDR